NLELIFLECSTEAIIQRYKETRRSHPLAFDGDLIEGINEEIKLLSEIKKYSDHTIDTTNYNVHKLKEIIQNIVGSDESKSLTLSFVSFGYKYGFPYDADIVWDVRFLQSPHFIKSLKDFDGYNEKIIEFVLSDNDSVEFIKKFQNMLDFLIPKYINEGKSYLTIAIGCTGGKHRSVVITNEISKKYHNYSPQIRHRDINKL
ncbi:MAG: RNase adapter RapZ, partial [Candidatus Dadabacteria bacterium]|nr:RNase adapter RapZ [Candidatus Dadabacteria bacterium]NIQ13417.1 RNase adapter RapZ [Candidatus Dadabacteria bacterium]